jgi:hypothetical protein
MAGEPRTYPPSAKAYRRRWKTRIELANAIFEYLEIFPQPAPPPQRPGHARPHRIRDAPPNPPNGMTANQPVFTKFGEDQSLYG